MVAMIVENFPEVLELTPERQLVLAAELFEKATDCSVEQPDPEIVRMLDKRVEEHREDPSGAAPWSEVKARILGSRGN